MIYDVWLWQKHWHSTPTTQPKLYMGKLDVNIMIIQFKCAKCLVMNGTLSWLVKNYEIWAVSCPIWTQMMTAKCCSSNMHVFTLTVLSIFNYESWAVTGKAHLKTLVPAFVLLVIPLYKILKTHLLCNKPIGKLSWQWNFFLQKNMDSC
jgi:hypothetical protein